MSKWRNNYFLKAVKKKVDSGLNNKDERGCTEFMIACEEGHEDVVQLLLHYLSLSNNRDYLIIVIKRNP